MNKLIEKLIGRLKKSDSSLGQKLARSLSRDKNLPMSDIVKKAFYFGIYMGTAQIGLRKCDKVGRYARNRRRPLVKNRGTIVIGDHFNLNSRNVQSDLVTGPDGSLIIGDEVTINFGTSIVARNKISIGNRTRIGPYTMIFDSNMHVHGQRFKRAGGEPVVIEEDAWLASKVTVLKGSIIGKGSVISAGSVVSGNIPPYSVAGGVPAKVIGYLNPEENIRMPRMAYQEKPDIPTELGKQVKQVYQRTFPDRDIESTISAGIDPVSTSYEHLKFINELERSFDIVVSNKDVVKMRGYEKVCRLLAERYLDWSNAQKKVHV